MFKITSRYSKNSKYINSAINKPSYFSLWRNTYNIYLN
jgi:hypothetical protein